MENKTLTKGFQKVLTTWRFDDARSFSEKFAQKRFYKKLEVPNDSNAKVRAENCFKAWLERDESLPISLPILGTLQGKWLNVAAFLKSQLRRYKPGEVRFTNGSEFTPTGGKNSMEAKLSRKFWDVTPEAFDRFSRLCFHHHGLKKAVKCKFNSWTKRNNFNRSEVNRTLYAYYLDRYPKTYRFEIFRWKLRRIVKLQHGSRFGTVPKNNEVDRPINIEPFGNVLLQLQVGSYLRSEIQRIYGIDLDTLSQEHRDRISNLKIATIDLSNASDLIALDLVRKVVPNHLLEVLMETRSNFVLGPDDCYYVPRKISAMGCGFTFELMTLLLLTLCRQYDDTATVYGDDIIIDRNYAEVIMRDLEEVGLEVNRAKSFWTGLFRESCGANWHADEGYITSYDVTYPTNMFECMVVYNKVKHLSTCYPSFKKMERALYGYIPIAMRGAPVGTFVKKYYKPDAKTAMPHSDISDITDVRLLFDWTESEGLDISEHFKCAGSNDLTINRKTRRAIEQALKGYCYNPEEFSIFQGLKWVPELRTETVTNLRSRQWAKYMMYLDAGRKVKDVVTGEGRWDTYLMVSNGYVTFNVAQLIPPHNGSFR